MTRPTVRRFPIAKVFAIVLFACALTVATSRANADENDTLNFRFYPFALAVGWLSADLDVRTTENWTLGPSFSYWKWSIDDSSFTSSLDTTFTRLGVRGNWFKNGIYTDGFYFAPSLDYRIVSIKTTDSSGAVSASGTALTATGLAGYGWFWKTFNMMLGAGLTLGVGPTKVEVKSSSGSTSSSVDASYGGSLALEYCLGWTF